MNFQRKALYRIAMLLVGFGAGVACARPASAQHRNDQGSHILVQAVLIASHEEIFASGENGALGLLRASGISDDEIRNGTVVGSIRYCCHEKTMMDTRIVFYAPPGFEVSVGDIVEVEIGRIKEKRRDPPETISRAVKVRESMDSETRACRWDPEDERMWARILYCSWMEAEGWQLERGLDKAWFKAAAD